MKKIFLIDDDQVLTRLLQQKLEKEGYEFQAVGDGADIEKKLKAGKPDLLLLDVDLPYKNGVKILEDIRNDAELKNLPVIVISNSGNPVDMYRIKQLGVKDYFIKVDFDLDKLAVLLAKYFLQDVK